MKRFNLQILAYSRINPKRPTPKYCARYCVAQRQYYIYTFIIFTSDVLFEAPRLLPILVAPLSARAKIYRLPPTLSHARSLGCSRHCYSPVHRRTENRFYMYSDRKSISRIKHRCGQRPNNSRNFVKHILLSSRMQEVIRWRGGKSQKFSSCVYIVNRKVRLLKGTERKLISVEWAFQR